MAFGNGRFVAVTGTNFLTSMDGRSWTKRPSGYTNATDVVRFGAGRFVAVGAKGTILGSVDGETWTAPQTGFTNTFRTLCYGGGLFVAGGNGVATSRDGINWTSATTPKWLYPLMYGKGRFVATGAAGTAISTNGLIWSISSDDYVNGDAVTYWKGMFIVGRDREMSISTDRVTWKKLGEVGANRFSSNDSIILASVARVVGSSDNWYSLDGTNWVRTPLGIAAIAFGDGKFIGVTTSGRVRRSTNGIDWDWNSPTAATNGLYCVVFGDGHYVAGGEGGMLQRSSDGLNWELLQSGVTNRMTGITYANGMFVASGRDGVALVSTNSVDWMRAETGTGLHLSRAAYGHGYWVMVGHELSNAWPTSATKSIVISSKDALHWDAAQPGAEEPLHDVIATPDGFFAVGNGTFRSGYFGPPSFKSVQGGQTLRLNVQGQVGERQRLQTRETFADTEWRDVAAFTQTNDVHVVEQPWVNGSQFFRVVSE